MGRAEEMKEQENRMKESLANIKKIILVMSGKGGVGKSTVAAFLAYKLSLQGNKVGLMDIDLHGPSIPTMFGVKNAKALNTEDGKVEPVKISDNLKVISIQFFLEQEDMPLIWRGPMKIGAIRQFMGDMEWENLDYLIIDAPPGTGDEALTVAQDFKGTESILVTTPQEISLSDVRKSIEFCKKVNLNILGIVENFSYFVCPKCNEKINFFNGSGAESLVKNDNLKLLTKLPMINGVVEKLDNGDIDELFENKKFVELDKKIEELINNLK